MQQKIRRDREKREERRMGGKQQLAKGRLRERWVGSRSAEVGVFMCCPLRDRWKQQQQKRMKKFMRHGHYDRTPVCTACSNNSVLVDIVLF